jgi:hypothetical protein
MSFISLTVLDMFTLSAVAAAFGFTAFAVSLSLLLS